MNPRQRRGVLLMVVAVVAGIGVFFAVSSYVADVNSQVGSRVTVFRAKQPLVAYATLDDADLEQVQVPRRWVSASAQLQRTDLEGRKVGLNVEKGTMLTRDMLVAPSDLSPTEREIAIKVDAVTGVAGRVQPSELRSTSTPSSPTSRGCPSRSGCWCARCGWSPSAASRR